MTNLLTKDHYDLMTQFEREHPGRFCKEDKALWPKGIIYQDGHVNELFLTYRRGYAFCEACMRGAQQPAVPEGWRQALQACAEHLGMLGHAGCPAAVNARALLSAQQPVRGQAQPLIARPLAEWHEDDGPVTWWAWCGRDWAGEPAWCGTPLDSDWPGYHTHWTPHPTMPSAQQPAQPECCGDPSDCWEPCGDMGKSEAHVRVSDFSLGDPERLCKGSVALGTGCRKCSRCRAEMDRATDGEGQA